MQHSSIENLINRGSHMSAHLYEFIKRVGERRQNVRLAEHLSFCATSLINSIIQEHIC